MTDEELDAIRKRCEAATPGPWYWWMSERPPFALGNDQDVNIGVEVAKIPDAEFVAAARADIPALLAEVDRLRAELVALEMAK